MGTHKHHIIPKHMGGTDDPSNLIELTIEEHAEAHRKLFEQYGRWQDEIAWKGLAGIIGKEEIIREVLSRAHRGVPKSEETKELMRIANLGNKNPRFGKIGTFTGRKHTEETKKIISEKLKGENHPYFGKKRPEHSIKMSGTNSPLYGKKLSKEAKEKISVANKGKRTGDKNPSAKRYKVTFPNGSSIITTSLAEFCREKDIPYDSLRCSLRTNKPVKTGKAKDWKLEYENQNYKQPNNNCDEIR